jgi:hypothetical protein
MRRDVRPSTEPARELALYERLISDGLAAADSRGGVIDHVTARRMAIWLLSRPQHPDFTRGLIRFTQTGVITHALKTQLRNHARSTHYPHQPQAARLMEYATARGADLGPVSTDFAGYCDQIDHADAMLADLRDRIGDGRGIPEPSWPDTDGQRLIAMARHDPNGRTVSLVLDATTANIAMHAITAHATDREAHIREVEQYGQQLPENSYGRRNRQAIAARETRVAARLRAIERAYRTAIDPDAIPRADPTQVPRSAAMAPDYELELE